MTLQSLFSTLFLMEKVFHPFLFLLIIIPLLLSGISFLKFYKYKNTEFLHLSEFYLSIMLVSVSSWLLLPLGSAYVILSMLPWMWTLRTFGLLCEDISKQKLFSKYHAIMLSLGGIISIIFLSFDFALPMVAAPFALSVGCIGFTFIFQSYSKGKMKSYALLHHLALGLIFSFFLSRITFPIFIANTTNLELPIFIDAFLLIAFCSSLYPLYAELVFEGHERMLKKTLQTRNKQLLSHSGFSEFKILSAGLSHEINNSLTIISAKITQIIRQRSKDPEKDMLIIQNATNRIIGSIRSLREFIYPHEYQETLDLGELLNEVLELYGQRLINHGVRVSISNTNKRFVKGQRVQLEQVFLSLINNSVEALDNIEDKWINISAKGLQGNVQITYQDSGPSRAQEFAPLLTNPEDAAHDFKENEIKLVIAKEIIKAHNGKLECVKHPDFSTFTITLPTVDSLYTSARLTNSEEVLH